MHWKVDRDYFIREIPSEQIEESGFFFDSSIEDVDINKSLDIMCTPLEFMRRSKAKNPAIVLLTGCFAPIHSGHIENITEARNVLLRNGYDEVFGFLAPDHDEYVKTKTKNDEYLIDDRICYALNKIKDISWFRIDSWAGLFNKGAVNFTDVVDRLQRYVNKHIGHIPVFLVVGGDNARFALAFQNKGGCVIISRPSYDISKYKYLVDNKRIFTGICDNTSSSTQERKNGVCIKRKKSKLHIRVQDERPEELYAAYKIAPFYTNYSISYVSQQKSLFKNNLGPIISLDL